MSIASDCGPTDDLLARDLDTSLLPNQHRCAVWREHVTRELLDSCPSPPTPHPSETEGDSDWH